MCNNDRNITRKEVMAYLVNVIKSRKFKIDEKMYSENFVANKLNVNRTMVHEVYTALEHMGIVECVHGEGTYLKKMDNLDLDSPLCLLMFLLSEDYSKVLEFRRIIELGIVDEVITKISDGDISKMQKVITNIENTDDYMIASENDIMIHSIFANSVDNPLISFVYNMAVVYITYISDNNWQKILSSPDIDMKNKQIIQHKNIINSVIEKNPIKCKQAIQDHILYIEKILS